MENRKVINKEKIIDSLNVFFNSIAFPLVVGVLILLKTIMFYDSTIIIRESIDKNLVIGTTMFIITFLGIIYMLPNRARIISTIILDLLISILLFADNLYYIYSSSVLSVAQIANLQYGEEIMGTIPMLIEIKQIIYFVDIILIIILLLTKILKIERKNKADWTIA